MRLIALGFDISQSALSELTPRETGYMRVSLKYRQFAGGKRRSTN
jgi:hypothetical protein